MNRPVDTDLPAALLAEARTRTDTILEEWAVRLANQVPGAEGQGLAYALVGPGKRIRPALVMAGYRSVGGRDDGIAVVAAAVETVHTYSLVHDDLPAIDNDDLRRGRETCHKVYGEAMAILAGDALLTAAFEMIGETTGVEEKRLLKVLLEVTGAAGSTGMIGGQVVDMESEGKTISFPELEYIHTHKTGRLILASVRCGALLGSATAAELGSLTAYAEATGLAFQILDDILDVEGSPEEMGKPVGGDAEKGKATYPALLGLAESKASCDELVKSAIKALEGFGEKAEPLRQIASYIISRRS